jgi:hypothetical protein
MMQRVAVAVGSMFVRNYVGYWVVLVLFLWVEKL